MRPNRWCVALAVLAGAVYVAMWCAWVQGWSWVEAADASTLDWTHRIGVEHHAWVSIWNAACTVFSPGVFRVVAVVLIVSAVVRRQVRIAVFLIVSVELSGPFTELMKRLADRPRPDTAFVDASSTSFPSGHALGDMVAVLALAVVLLPHVRPTIRPWLVGVGAAVVVSVGVGRVALNVHHLSDVVAGWALGYVYFALCLLILRSPAATAAAETPEAPGI